ncbi:MATE family efflux transporter [Streptosporangium sandarakinum]|uniref:MATE family efflux transporter n=1 Tax=Streptosporangium sandarakinum TaxID=1260955 RepID=UPI00344592C3
MKLLRLALPVYVELLTAVVAVGLIDLLWVSPLGGPAVATVTIATAAENLALGVVLAVSTGTTVAVGRRDGREPLGPVVRTAWLLGGAVSLAVAVPGVLLREPLARLFTEDPGTARLTAGFFLVSLGGLPVFYAQTITDGIFKGLGDTATPMRTALLCNALVIALDPLFVYGLGMGVQGAAAATVAARAVALGVALTLLSRRLSRHAASGPPARARRPDDADTARAGRTGGTGDAGKIVRVVKAGGTGEAGEIVRTGLPMSGDFLARSLVGMLMVELVGGFGVTPLAAYGTGTKIMLAGVMAFYALRQAAMIQTARSGRAGPTLSLGLAAGGVVAAVLNAVAVPAAGLFTSDAAVAAGTVDFLRWMTLYLVPFGALIAAGGTLQASGRGGRVLAATLAGFAVQLGLAHALGAALGVTGVWSAMAAGTALAAVLVAVPAAAGSPAGKPVAALPNLDS